MKIRCEYCNSYIDESEEKCPSCGSPNKDFKRVGNQVPTTIQELEEWYQAHNLPPYETTRFSTMQSCPPANAAVPPLSTVVFFKVPPDVTSRAPLPCINVSLRILGEQK